MELLEAIGKRRSVRAYREGRIARETVLEILRAGTLAPSGKNGQPWRFAVVQENRARFAEIAALTVYRAFAERADCLVLVFLDKAESYHYVKDCQAIGACIEKMLLRATDLGIGSLLGGGDSEPGRRGERAARAVRPLRPDGCRGFGRTGRSALRRL